MLDDGALIGILKWAALALVPASALWGLLGPKPARDEADGRKRLTRAGVVTVALMLASAAISALSFRLDAALGEKKAAEQARNEAVRKRFDMASGALTMINTINSRTALAKLDRERVERRADAVDARIAALDRDTRERLRDLELAQKVATGTRDNLARTGVALTQIERVLQPLETMTVEVTWDIQDTSDNRAALSRLKGAARRVTAAWLRAWREADDEKPRKLDTFPVDYKSGAEFGETAAERNLLQDIDFSYTLINFFASERSPDDMIKMLRAAVNGSRAGDLGFQVDTAERPELEYVLESGALRFRTEATVAPDAMGRTGKVISYPDFEHATAIVRLMTFGPEMETSRLHKVRVRSPSRSYVWERDDIQVVRRGNAGLIFLLPRKKTTRLVR